MPLARGCLQRDAAYLDALGVPVTARSMADRDHFDLPLNLADPATPFGRVSQVHLGLQESPRIGRVTSRDDTPSECHAAPNRGDGRP